MDNHQWWVDLAYTKFKVFILQAFKYFFFSTTVSSRVLTRLVLKHTQAFTDLLMKGIFDASALWPFDKKMIS